MRRASPVVSLSTLVALAWVTSGCSLIFVKGPQPEVQPPPPCTAANDLPAADAVLAGLSMAALVAGAVVYVNGKSQEESGCSGRWFCGFGEEVGGAGAMIIGGIGTLVFTPSAIVGFNRTSACRASAKANPQPAPSPPVPAAPASRLAPPRGCPSEGDAPRLCANVAAHGAGEPRLTETTQ